MSQNSEALKFDKYVYDSVHGNIGLTETELGIIDSPIFQRLHRIRQLGVADLVYPGATHTRFAHSLGAMFVMNEYLERVTRDGKPIAVDADTKQKLRLAALCHDIGHYPFSHALEFPIQNHFKCLDHEKQGYRIIMEILKDYLETYKSQEILDIMKKSVTNNVYPLLISSDFDVDKLDYLMRDSFQTGVAYGNVDSDRLLRTLSFDAQGTIVFEKPGPVIENFLLARYHMFQAVYYHKTVLAFNVMMEKIYEQLVEAGEIVHPKDITTSTDEWMLARFDDDCVWQAMHHYLSLKKGDYTSVLIEAIFRRDPLALPIPVALPADQGTEPAEYNKVRVLKHFDQKRKELAKCCGVPQEWILPCLTPKPISMLPDDVSVLIKHDNNPVNIQDDSALIFKRLGPIKFYVAGIYCKSEYSDSIRTN